MTRAILRNPSEDEMRELVGDLGVEEVECIRNWQKGDDQLHRNGDIAAADKAIDQVYSDSFKGQDWIKIYYKEGSGELRFGHNDPIFRIPTELEYGTEINLESGEELTEYLKNSKYDWQ